MILRFTIIGTVGIRKKMDYDSAKIKYLTKNKKKY